jgi:hypothetical protein
MGGRARLMLVKLGHSSSADSAEPSTPIDERRRTDPVRIEAERKVLRALDEDVSLDRIQVACAALVPPGQTSRVLDHLEEQGVVRVVDVGKRLGPRYLRAR